MLSPQDKAMVMLLLIVALVGLGILLVIALLAAWRNYIQRQRDIEFEHDEREADLPRPDAWSTAAQRMDPPDADPDEAHIGPNVDPDNGFDEQQSPNGPRQGHDFEDDEDDDEDDFPFDRGEDDEDDDDGPLGQA